MNDLDQLRLRVVELHQGPRRAYLLEKLDQLIEARRWYFARDPREQVPPGVGVALALGVARIQAQVDWADGKVNA